jgi:cation:H+ antiporter
MLELILLLLLSILIVFISALLFVNAIEFLGSQYKIGGPFVGSILSPLFTSLPELIVLIIALFGLGGANGEEVGVGTIFGEPLMASSLSYGLVGILALVGYYLKRREHKTLQVDTSLAVPFIFVTILFPLTLIPSLLNSSAVRILFGVGFLSAYFGYLVLMYRRKDLEQIENAKTPYICKIIPPKRIGGFVQLIVSVVVLYFGAREMVGVVNELALGLGLSLMGLSIIVVPAATAVPETASALIWGFRGQDTLSIASLVGEKVLYTTLFPGIGLLLTAWVLDVHAYLSVLATTTISILMLIFILKKRIPWYALTVGFLFFVAYAAIVFWLRI